MLREMVFCISVSFVEMYEVDMNFDFSDVGFYLVTRPLPPDHQCSQHRIASLGDYEWH